jgi:hypothetical protein
MVVGQNDGDGYVVYSLALGASLVILNMNFGFGEKRRAPVDPQPTVDFQNCLI